MAATNAKLTAAVETYFGDLRRMRASGGATGERSTYPPLTALLNAVGATLKPRVFCVSELADHGAGHPDLGLYATRQVQRGTPREGQVPERGVIEVKSADDDAWLTADSDQVSRYRSRYRLVLVTNTRDFVLVGEDADGLPAKLESFRLAGSAQEFERLLQTPRVFARRVGAGLGEYLCRALSHRAALAEPKDLAWLLASYARDGLARVEAAGDEPSLATVRSALEQALGVRFEGERGADVDQRDADNDPVLHEAIWRGHTDVVRSLVDAGADVDAKDSDDDPVLHEAIFRGHTEIVRILVNAGVDVNANDSRGRSALNRALFWAGDDSEIVPILLEAQSTQTDLAWPTDCVELNDIVENHLGNDNNVGIYQSVFGDQAEQGCRGDHREDVRSVFGWAFNDGT